MSSDRVLKEAERVMVFCNACRYCEGFCAVFPAMELRRTFRERDLNYLANLCHNCRDCYYACQYAPPHEYALNIPKALAELRLDTYQKFCRPRLFANVFRRNGLMVSLFGVLGVVIIFLLTLFLRGPEQIFATHIGEKAFYNVIPYAYMVVPVMVLVLLISASLLIGLYHFWRAAGGSFSQLYNLRAHLTAMGDVLRLKYLDGGGYGCNYPDERFSMGRRWLHHFVFYGFLLCFASTTAAAIYEHFFHLSAPYPFWSWPVMLGTTGGIALLIGTGGLFYLRLRMDVEPATPRSFGMDISFLVLLFLASLSGLVLLLLRETRMMGTLLIVHLGFVVGILMAIPYGKLIHAFFRYAALVKNAIEQSRENP